MIKRNHRIMQSTFRPLAGYIMLGVMLLGLGPMLIAGALIMDRFEAAYREKTQAHLKELVQKHAQAIDTFIDGRIRDVRLLATTAPPALLRDSVFLAGRLKLMRAMYQDAFEDLSVIDTQGVQIAYAGPFDLLGVGYHDAKWFQTAMTTDIFVSDVFWGVRKQPHFVITARIKCAGDDCLLRATIDFSAFCRQVKSLRVGDTGYAAVYNRGAESQSGSPPLQGVMRRFYMELFTDLAAAKSGVMIREFDETRGQTCLYIAVGLKTKPWMMILRQDKADAEAALRKTQKTVFNLMLMVSYLVLVVSTIVTVLVLRLISGAMAPKESKDGNNPDGASPFGG